MGNTSEHGARTLTIATAPKRNSRHWKNGTVQWRTLLGWADKPKNAKECGNYLLGRLSQTTVTHTGEGTPCTEVHRRKENIVSRSAVALDADSPGPDFLADVAALGCEALVHTTFSSRPDAPRYRVIVLTDRDMSPDEYRRTATWLVREMGEQHFDASTTQPERYMFKPAAERRDWYTQCHCPGQLVDVDHALSQVPDDDPAVAAPDHHDVDVSAPPTDRELDLATTLLTVYAQRVSTAPKGDRNTALIRWLPTAYRFVLGDCLDEEAVDDAMRDAAAAAGIEDEFDHVRGNAWRLALQDGADRPRDDDPASVFGVVPVHERRPGFPAPSGEAPDAALRRCHQTFRKWLGRSYDTDALDVVLAAAAVERLDGDPLWLMLISGPGNAKTETVQALAGVGALVESTIASEGAFLSATSKREKTKGATGGLLRRIGPDGVLVIKDVTSILSMARETRATVLGALREIYDGRWSRNVGTDGGQTLLWAGRIAVIGAVTSKWDAHHEVIAAMGDRFVLLRTDSGNADGRLASGRQALANIGSEVDMRTELAGAVRGVVAAMHHDPGSLSRTEVDRLLAAADLVTRARSAVERDYRGEPLSAHDPETPTRLAKQLGQVVRGALAIGVDRDDALRLAVRAARDSMPPVRLKIIDDLAAWATSDSGSIGEASPVSDIRRRVDLPRTTVDRELQAMHLLGLVRVHELEYGVDKVRWCYRLADGIDPNAIYDDTLESLL